MYFNGTKPWLQHEDLGWIHVPEEGGEDNATWMWSEDLGWFWTGEAFYPRIYLQEFASWSSVQKDPNTGQTIVFDYDAKAWLTPQQHMTRRLQFALDQAKTGSNILNVIDRSPALTRQQKDVIISELLIQGRSKTLTDLGISLGF